MTITRNLSTSIHKRIIITFILSTILTLFIVGATLQIVLEKTYDDQIGVKIGGVTEDSGWGPGVSIRQDRIRSDIRSAVWKVILLVSSIILSVCTVGLLFVYWIGKQWRVSEESPVKQNHAIEERIKELNCLYGISNIVENSDFSITQILQGVVDLIPPSWQYPDLACSRIKLEKQEYRTTNFKQTNWKQTAEIRIRKKQIGMLEVFYTDQMPESDEGPFLFEERHLINAIAKRIGKIVEQKQAEEALCASLKKLKANEKNLRKSQKIAKIGSYTWNIETQFIECSDEMYTLFGLSKEDYNPNTQNYLALVQYGFRIIGNPWNCGFLQGKN